MKIEYELCVELGLKGLYQEIQISICARLNVLLIVYWYDIILNFVLTFLLLVYEF
jgi:hypothetical protein